MSEGEKKRPILKIQIAKKTAERGDKSGKAYIGAAWLSDDGKKLQAKWDRDVVAVIFKDAQGNKRRANVEDVWLNIYDDRMRPPEDVLGGGTSAPPQNGGTGSDDPDDIPF